MSFPKLKHRLDMGDALGKCFVLCKPELAGVVFLEDVFTQKIGVFCIECKHYHAEDIDHPDESEGIPHYVMLNAGTGMLYTYPEMLVLTDDDRRDLDTFFKQLKAPPYLLLFERRSSVKVLTRQVFVEVSPRALELPYSHPSHLAQLLE